MSRKTTNKPAATSLNSEGNAGETDLPRVSQLTAVPKGEVRKDGLQIDGFGLPVNGPARIRILSEIDAKDPLAAPNAWTDATAAKARKLTEKFYG